MSIAGVQDKLLVYLDRPLSDGGRMFLVEPPLASTHILKPDPARQATLHLVVNEHFCMSLARRMKLPVAEVGIYRTPRPVLVVRRFDRVVLQGAGEGDAHGANEPTVQRLHIIDACQLSDLSESFKYEPALSRGELQCVGATTMNEYRKYIEKDAALERRFQTVKVNEPSVEDAIKILMGLKSKYELHHRARFSEKAIEAAVNLSSRYLPSRDRRHGRGWGQGPHRRDDASARAQSNRRRDRNHPRREGDLHQGAGL